MTRSAIVENGIVTNVIVGELPGSVPCPDDVSVGWTYAGGEYLPPPAPPPPVPEWVHMFQLRKAMRRTPIDLDRPQYGDMLSALAAYVAAAADPDLTDEFNAATVRRDHATVEAKRRGWVSGADGLTTAQHGLTTPFNSLGQWRTPRASRRFTLQSSHQLLQSRVNLW